MEVDQEGNPAGPLYYYGIGTRTPMSYADQIIIDTSHTNGGFSYVDEITVTAIPEPSSAIVTLGMAVTGLLAYAWRRKRRR